jgi:DedD protein
MAGRQEAETEFEPRHRILGAVILVTLGFIMFSVVLNEQPQRLDPEAKAMAVAPDTRVVVTPVPQAKPVPAVQPKVVDNPLAPKHLVKKPVVPEPVPDEPMAAETARPVVVKTVPARKATKPAKKTAKASGKRWMVQVGTFSDPANARRLSNKLKSQQYRVVMKVVALKNSSAVRVRVGPFKSKQSAATARDRINKKNGIKGVVLAQR